jgi:hypothetical protein
MQSDGQGQTLSSWPNTRVESYCTLQLTENLVSWFDVSLINMENLVHTISYNGDGINCIICNLLPSSLPTITLQIVYDAEKIKTEIPKRVEYNGSGCSFVQVSHDGQIVRYQLKHAKRWVQ